MISPRILGSTLGAALLGLALVSLSCSFVPNTLVRVAVPESQTETWQKVVAALGPDVRVELVDQDSFPPPDLLWFARFDADFDENALAPHAGLETLGTAAGVGRPWFDQRLYPLAWSPWSWWTFAPGTKLPPLTALDAPALAAFQAATTPQMGTAGHSLPSTVDDNRVWLSWAAVQASPERVNLAVQPGVAATGLATQVRALWWNRRGWNPERVPELLARLWSPAIRALWVEPGWLDLAQGPRLEVDQPLVIYTPANE